MKIRIAAAQINTTVGDIKGNVELIEKNIEKSLNYGVDIIAFPELSITGYPPEDLLHNEEFISKNLNGVKLLGNGEIKVKLNITISAFSKNAEKAIKKLGGSLTAQSQSQKNLQSKLKDNKDQKVKPEASIKKEETKDKKDL